MGATKKMKGRIDEYISVSPLRKRDLKLVALLDK